MFVFLDLQSLLKGCSTSGHRSCTTWYYTCNTEKRIDPRPRSHGEGIVSREAAPLHCLHAPAEPPLMLHCLFSPNSATSMLRCLFNPIVIGATCLKPCCAINCKTGIITDATMGTG